MTISQQWILPSALILSMILNLSAAWWVSSKSPQSTETQSTSGVNWVASHRVHPKLIHTVPAESALVQAVHGLRTRPVRFASAHQDDFNRAMNWMTELRRFMPDIFKAGAGMRMGRRWRDLSLCLTLQSKGPVIERKIINFAKDRVPLHSIERVIHIMTMGECCGW